jgi:hypothetical protein
MPSIDIDFRTWLYTHFVEVLAPSVFSSDSASKSSGMNCM